MKRLNILGVEVDMRNMEQTCQYLTECVEKKKQTVVYTPNSEIILHAYKNEPYREILSRGDVITPDGIGVVYASRILGHPMEERVGGFDLVNKLFDHIRGKGKTIYLFGSKPGVADAAVEKIKTLYPGSEIVGTQNGYFDEKKEQEILADIREKQPDVLLVCLGFPKQEEWIDAHRKQLPDCVIMGLGGSLDVFAGTVKRAPVAFQKLGLEWLYRLIKQPTRFVRMLALPKFGFTVLFHGKKFLKEN